MKMARVEQQCLSCGYTGMIREDLVTKYQGCPSCGSATMISPRTERIEQSYVEWIDEEENLREEVKKIMKEIREKNGKKTLKEHEFHLSHFIAGYLAREDEMKVLKDEIVALRDRLFKF